MNKHPPPINIAWIPVSSVMGVKCEICEDVEGDVHTYHHAHSSAVNARMFYDTVWRLHAFRFAFK